MIRGLGDPRSRCTRNDLSTKLGVRHDGGAWPGVGPGSSPDRPTGGPMVGQFDTHDVFNQAPPLEDYDVFAADPALSEARRPRGRGVGPTRARDPGRAGRLGVGPGARATGQRAPAGTAHPRPVRPPDRRRRVPPRLPRAHEDVVGPRPARGTVGRSPCRGPRGPGGQGDRLVPGRRRSHLPGVDDLRRRARPSGTNPRWPRSGSR